MRRYEEEEEGEDKLDVNLDNRVFNFRRVGGCCCFWVSCCFFVALLFVFFFLLFGKVLFLGPSGVSATEFIVDVVVVGFDSSLLFRLFIFADDIISLLLNIARRGIGRWACCNSCALCFVVAVANLVVVVVDIANCLVFKSYLLCSV